MPLGEKIHELRIKKGFTQSELAQGICTPSMISQIESDRANPSDKVLQALADRLGADLEDIQQGESSVWEHSATLMLADSLLLDNQTELAKTVLLAYTPETEAFTRYHKLLSAQCYMQQFDYSTALSLLEDLEEQTQGDPIYIFHVWLKMARLYIETGKQELGSHYYKKAYHLCLNETSITLLDKWNCITELCLFYLEENRHQELAAVLSETAARWPIPTALHELARSFVQQAQEARCGKRFQHAHTLAQSAHTLFSSLNLLQGITSLQYFANTVLQNKPPSAIPAETSIGPQALAVLHLNAGNLDKAAAMVHLALRQAATPRQKTVALQTLTQIQEAQGNFMQAADTLRSIIQLWEAHNSPEQVTKYSSQLTQILLRAASQLHENRE